MMRKIILYIAVSLDGKIAGLKGDITWLDEFNSPDEDYGYKKFLDSVDVTLMGHNTYDQVWSFEGEFPYKDKKNYVFTGNASLSQDENVSFISSDHLTFVQQLKKEPGKNIWLIGGSKINHFFLKNNLIDEMIVFVIPVFLGEGIPLFEASAERRSLNLVKEHRYKNGVIELNYRIKND